LERLATLNTVAAGAALVLAGRIPASRRAIVTIRLPHVSSAVVAAHCG